MEQNVKKCTKKAPKIMDIQLICDIMTEFVITQYCKRGKRDMAKKLISVWLSLTILIFSSISIYAGEIIQGDFFLKNIVINGENIVNYKLSNPVLFHENRVYIPMDTEMGNMLGVEAELDNESRTLKILKTDVTQANVTQDYVKNNLDDVQVTSQYDYKIVVYSVDQEKDACLTGKQANATKRDEYDVLWGLESIEEIACAQIDLKGQPVLVRNEIVYVPLNAIVSSEILGWSSYYDNYAGVYISTDDEIDAASYFDASEAKYYEALTAYIINKNPKLTKTEALEMVKYFEAYGQIYGMDLELLMAQAECESTYRPTVVNSQNCCGLLQIKVSTGASYGFTKSQLLQAKPNIQMGAIYLGQNIETFNGDVTKALSAYNCGTGAVLKGNYSTRYAKKVLKRQANIESFVASYNG